MMNDQAMLYDDRIVSESSTSSILLSDAADHVHQLPEQWLRSRVRGWMELVESPGLAFWIGTYTPEGKWIFCSSNSDMWAPKPFRQEYAMRVCRHINRHCANGGAWLTGWNHGGREFYMLWKDPSGDLQIPIECDKPFVALQHYTDDDWAKHCHSALMVWTEHTRNLELTESQTVNLAQGEAISPNHMAEAPEQTI